MLWIKVIYEKAVMTLCKTSGHCYLVFVYCIAYDVVCVACNKFYQVRWFNICLMVNQCHHYWFDDWLMEGWMGGSRSSVFLCSETKNQRKRLLRRPMDWLIDWLFYRSLKLMPQWVLETRIPFGCAFKWSSILGYLPHPTRDISALNR